MAREKGQVRRITGRPSQAEEGGGRIGFPPGSTVTIVEARSDTWGSAGETALKGGRAADDPALVLVGSIDGVDEDRTVFLGAGKANRIQPSRDGEFFEPADGSTAQGLNNNCNAQIFLDSVFYEDKKSVAFKKHGKMAVHADALEDGYSKALVGLKFVAGAVVPEGREDLAQDSGKKPRPTLVAEEILEPPSGDGKPTKTSGGRRARKEEVEEEEAPRRRSRRAAEDDKDKDKDNDADVEQACEAAIVEALDSPKFRKGLPIDRAFAAVYALVRKEDNADEIAKVTEDHNWLKHKGRPWTYDKVDDVLLPA